MGQNFKSYERLTLNLTWLHLCTQFSLHRQKGTKRQIKQNQSCFSFSIFLFDSFKRINPKWSHSVDIYQNCCYYIHSTSLMQPKLKNKMKLWWACNPQQTLFATLLHRPHRKIVRYRTFFYNSSIWNYC